MFSTPASQLRSGLMESVYHEEDVNEEQPYVAAPETEAMKEPLAG